jgi:SAM-dependent methyltransferase
MKINVGCGTNRLKGWENFDSEIDITKPLPFPTKSANFIFAEHVVEHVGFYEALEFLKECKRVLKPTGVIRIAVPSVERIMLHGDAEYWSWASKWVPGAPQNLRGALHSIIYCHGHKAAWTDALLEAALTYVGFHSLVRCRPGKSQHSELTGVEGHHTVIGVKYNDIETSVVEGTA